MAQEGRRCIELRAEWERGHSDEARPLKAKDNKDEELHATLKLQLEPITKRLSSELEVIMSIEKERKKKCRKVNQLLKRQQQIGI
jgi:peptide subunit release factor RF-3